jgi:hypothetical protein
MMFKTTRANGPPAVLSAPPDGEADDARLLLTKVRRTLADLLRAAADGEGAALGQITLKQSELESALKKVFEAEQRYHEWTRNHGGGTADDIDYDAIRHQIGCRLARLRDCCQD